MQIPEEMKKKYVERRRKDADTLSAGLASGSLEAFANIGHQLKGNAATFGFDELALIGERMEAAAESADQAAAQACLNDFNEWIQRHP
jgi:HPt (histidine-containing phosphotransfer) domain-containing protein